MRMEMKPQKVATKILNKYLGNLEEVIDLANINDALKAIMIATQLSK